ncbi:MAG: glycosyltransferase [Candidatus Saccharibacteria bacterium]|nr:glycosyltransferase [Candidatus Saccharibacteria bacterium]
MPKTKQLRIALFIDDFYPASGGIARSVQTQIIELTRMGHTVTLFVPKHFLERPAECQTVVVPSLYLPGTPSYMCILRHNQRLARRITKQHRFDIVHSQTERGGLVLAARIARLLQVPHIHTFHANLAGTHASQPFVAFWGSMAYLVLINPAVALASRKRRAVPVRFAPSSADGPSFFARFDWHSLATIASRVDAYTTPAQFMIQRIGECGEGLAEQGHVIPTGINPALQTALANTPRQRHDTTLRFLSVCRLAPEKRVDAIIQAFLLAKIPNARLDIVGPGDQRPLRKLAHGRENIVFHGGVSAPEELAAHYRNTDVFVLASDGFDTQAMTITEAVAAGLPVIYCDQRLTVGVSEYNSLLAASGAPEDLANCMRRIADAKLRRQLASASRRAAPDLAPSHMAKHYLALYHSLQK